MVSLQQQQQTLLVPLFLRVLNNVEYLYPKKKQLLFFFLSSGSTAALIVEIALFLALVVCCICLGSGIYGVMACRFYISVTHLQAFSQKMKKRPKVLVSSSFYNKEIGAKN